FWICDFGLKKETVPALVHNRKSKMQNLKFIRSSSGKLRPTSVQPRREPVGAGVVRRRIDLPNHGWPNLVVEAVKVLVVIFREAFPPPQIGPDDQIHP